MLKNFERVRSNKFYLIMTSLVVVLEPKLSVFIYNASLDGVMSMFASLSTRNEVISNENTISPVDASPLYSLRLLREVKPKSQ